MNRLKLTYALNVKFKSVARTIFKAYQYTGVQESVRVPLPPFVIHYLYLFTYPYFKSTDK